MPPGLIYTCLILNYVNVGRVRGLTLKSEQKKGLL